MLIDEFYRSTLYNIAYHKRLKNTPLIRNYMSRFIILYKYFIHYTQSQNL